MPVCPSTPAGRSLSLILEGASQGGGWVEGRRPTAVERRPDEGVASRERSNELFETPKRAMGCATEAPVHPIATPHSPGKLGVLDANRQPGARARAQDKNSKRRLRVNAFGRSLSWLAREAQSETGIWQPFENPSHPAERVAKTVDGWMGGWMDREGKDAPCGLRDAKPG